MIPLVADPMRHRAGRGREDRTANRCGERFLSKPTGRARRRTVRSAPCGARGSPSRAQRAAQSAPRSNGPVYSRVPGNRAARSLRRTAPDRRYSRRSSGRNRAVGHRSAGRKRPGRTSRGLPRQSPGRQANGLEILLDRLVAAGQDDHGARQRTANREANSP